MPLHPRARPRRRAGRGGAQARQDAADVYRLRQKPGAQSFAAAWDAATDFARQALAAGRGPSAGVAGADTLLVPRYYRGRLIGFVQREDAAGAMRMLGQLDRMADRAAQADTEERMQAFRRLTDLGSDKGDGIAK